MENNSMNGMPWKASTEKLGTVECRRKQSEYCIRPRCQACSMRNGELMNHYILNIKLWRLFPMHGGCRLSWEWRHSRVGGHLWNMTTTTSFRRTQILTTYARMWWVRQQRECDEDANDNNDDYYNDDHESKMTTRIKLMTTLTMAVTMTIRLRQRWRRRWKWRWRWQRRRWQIRWLWWWIMRVVYL